MITLSGGAFQDAGGNKLVGGRLVLQLSTDAQETTTNPDGQVVSQLPITIALDANGNAPATQVYSNAELTPAGTYYTVRLYSSAGQLVWAKPQTWVFSQASGESIDIGTITPGSASTPSYPGAILKIPKSTQIISGGYGIHNDGGFYGAFHGPVTDTTESTFNVLNATEINADAINASGGSINADLAGDVTGDLEGDVTSAGTSTFNILHTKAPVANVKAFGAVGDGVADDSAAINAAIASGAGDIYLPAGTYKLDSPINLTKKIGITLRGDGARQTTGAGVTSLLGNTGNVVLDLMGSSFLKIENMRIRVESAYATPAKVAILQGRSTDADATYQYSEFCSFENLYIYMDSLPAASARGRVGIYNVGAEHSRYQNVFVIADLPLAMAATDVLSIVSPNAGAHGGPASMTVCHSDNSGFRAWTQAGTEFWAAENIRFTSCYWSRQAGSTTEHPIGINANCSQIYFSGQLEEWPGVVNFKANCDSCQFDLFSVGPTQALVYSGAGAGTVLSNMLF
jgi:hypothetical protein